MSKMGMETGIIAWERFEDGRAGLVVRQFRVDPTDVAKGHAPCAGTCGLSGSSRMEEPRVFRQRRVSPALREMRRFIRDRAAP